MNFRILHTDWLIFYDIVVGYNLIGYSRKSRKLLIIQLKNNHIWRKGRAAGREPKSDLGIDVPSRVNVMDEEPRVVPSDHRRMDPLGSRSVGSRILPDFGGSGRVSTCEIAYSFLLIIILGWPELDMPSIEYCIKD